MTSDAPVVAVVIADDYGVNEARSAGIRAAFRHGALSAASAVANGAASAAAVRLAVAAGLPLGLHFNITEGVPLCAPASLPLLVAPATGAFRGKAAAFLRLSSLVAGTAAFEAAAAEISAELAAQAGWLLRCVAAASVAGCAPSSGWHLDGHHHVHVLPVVWAAMERTVATHRLLFTGLTRIRVPFDPTLQLNAPAELQLPQPTTFLVAEECFGPPFWTRVSALAAGLRSSATAARGAADAFVGFELTGAAMSPAGVLAKVVAAAAASSRASSDDSSLTRIAVWDGKRWPPVVASQRSACAVVEVMTHVGGAHKGPVADATFWHDAFSTSLEREHESTAVVAAFGRSGRGRVWSVESEAGKRSVVVVGTAGEPLAAAKL